MQKHINNIINTRVIFINYSFNEYKYIDKMIYDHLDQVSLVFECIGMHWVIKFNESANNIK